MEIASKPVRPIMRSMQQPGPDLPMPDPQPPDRPVDPSDPMRPPLPPIEEPDPDEPPGERPVPNPDERPRPSYTALSLASRRIVQAWTVLAARPR
jgi:hypothetical protein